MKIKQSQLKQIIKEELEVVAKEAMQGGTATLPTKAGHMSLGEAVTEAPEVLLKGLLAIAQKNPQFAEQIMAMVRNRGAAQPPSMEEGALGVAGQYFKKWYGDVSKAHSDRMGRAKVSDAEASIVPVAKKALLSLETSLQTVNALTKKMSDLKMTQEVSKFTNILSSIQAAKTQLEKLAGVQTPPQEKKKRQGTSLQGPPTLPSAAPKPTAPQSGAPPNKFGAKK
jgi:hypothetical protein